MFDTRPDIWLPTYALGTADRIRGRLNRSRQLTHIIFLVCDHFEPRHGISSDEQPRERVATWHREYARLQARVLERFGTVPLHSFFYPPHHGIEHLARLSNMVFDGLGEVELHYHHDGDTEESFRSEFGAAVAEFQRWGFLLESGEQPRSSFGFIHGDWALNNSCKGRYCGVNDELTILREFGCWADLTMPSGGICQTRKINSIYYATSTPHSPKSHDRGVDARVGADTPGMLMIQGPLAINWRAPDHPRRENASLTTRNWGRPDRIQKWLDCNIHVKGRPDWQFVKLHTHGAIERDFDGLFGERAFEMHCLLNEHYNDGQRYRLHYVTARQAYNLVKAAEHGMQGDPSAWLDYVLPPQPHTFYTVDARHKLQSCTPDRLVVTDIEANGQTTFRTNTGSIRSIRGAMGSIRIDQSIGVVQVQSLGQSKLQLELMEGVKMPSTEGGRLTELLDRKGSYEVTFSSEKCVMSFCDPVGA